jgi:hypothetical protein
VPTTLTQEQNLLFHSYFTVSLLVELKSNDLLKSDYFDGMRFSAPWIKDELRKIGVNNQGCAMMLLYAMLVLPREIIHEDYSSEYDKIDDFLKKHTKNTATTYRSDVSSVKYLRHIRNAVAHASVKFSFTDTVIFNDENPRNNEERFSTELSLQHLSELLHLLQMVHIAYIQDLQKQSGRSD